MELPMAPGLPYLEPTIGFDQSDQFFDFHALLIAQVRIPVNVTDDSGIVTGHSGERDRG